MSPGNWEDEKVFMIRKPGDLPVMAVIYLRERDNARRKGFFVLKITWPFGLGYFLFAVYIKKVRRCISWKLKKVLMN